mmetsp:Transcript_87091/g.172898  ORF Transcript_87091/g.172898 Transcript_87091/m.172898 type:complete len:674 (+) Transcript_87091:84-2105(+)
MTEDFWKQMTPVAPDLDINEKQMTPVATDVEITAPVAPDVEVTAKTRHGSVRMIASRRITAIALAVGMTFFVGGLVAVVVAITIAHQSEDSMSSIDEMTRSELESFRTIDSNGDGFLNSSELDKFHRGLPTTNTSSDAAGWIGGCASNASAMAWARPHSATDPIVEFILFADNDHSGTVDFAEYVSLGTKKLDGGGTGTVPGARRTAAIEAHHSMDQTALAKEQQLLSRWDGGFDKDASMGLNMSELEKLLRFQGEATAPGEVATLMMELDKDKNGQISLMEISNLHDHDPHGREPALDGENRRLQATYCNGGTNLCNRRFNEVAYATTHNSYNSQKSHYIYPNQIETMLTQLSDGIRGFMIDLHIEQGGNTVFLCHGGQADFLLEHFCPGGKQPAAEALAPMREWLERHTREIVTFILEVQGPSDAQVQQVFINAGFGKMLYDPAAASEWPTLGQMIADGRRVVLLGAGHARHVRIQQTPWNYKSREESGITVHDDRVTCGSTCTALSGLHQAVDDLDVHVLNHFISYPTARTFALQMNFEKVLSARAERWRADHGRIPNFIAVDFYEIGNLFQVVDALNDLSQRPWACRQVGYTDFSKRFCCPGNGWLSGTCGRTGSCNKASGQCSCHWDWERGFDCSKRVCQHGSKCSKWGWCWNRIPGCCEWTSFTWWC